MTLANPLPTEVGVSYPRPFARRLNGDTAGSLWSKSASLPARLPLGDDSVFRLLSSTKDRNRDFVPIWGPIGAELGPWRIGYSPSNWR